jgi:L-alanine-DL-glutamate epimerase-like enolase superfamily enzyme
VKITKVITRLVEIPLPRPVHYAWVPGSTSEKLRFTLVEILTDEGIVGIGASHICADTEVAISVQSLVTPFLLGKDPFETERLIKILHSANPFGTRPWLVDQALWDIVGKACGQPLYRLWGGYQKKIPAYFAPSEQRSPQETAEVALHARENGYKACKLRIHHDRIENDLKLVQVVREAVGDRMDLMVDANQALLLNSPKPHPVWDYQRALTTARELEHLEVYFLEEPLPIRDFNGIARLTQETQIKIAGGEWNIGIQEFKWMLEKGCYDILQPDATQSEGLFQMRKIAVLAELENKLFIPHTWGNGIGLAANFQVALAVPNCPYFEYPCDPETFGVDVFQRMVKNPLMIDPDGFIHASDTPGLGIELDREFVEKHTSYKL